MTYEHITEYAGWFLATPNTWKHHFYGEHYITARHVTDDMPHYKMRGALSGFAEWFVFEKLYYRTRDYREVLDEYNIAVPDDEKALAELDVTYLNAECILAIISKCVYEDPRSNKLLRKAAASSLLDRCLLKLADIDRMDHPNWDYKGKRRSPAPSSQGSWLQYDEDHLPEWVWCLVGNVVDEHPQGEDHVIVHGTKHFRPGTKVYCLPSQWGDGYEQIAVLGKHKGQRGLIAIVMGSRLIENFRCQKVYSPYVIRKMYQSDFIPWGNSESDHECVQSLAKWLNMTDEEVKRRTILARASRIALSSCVEGIEGGSAELVIERRTRRDGCYGGAWYGSCRLGDEDERDIGMLDWYGYWPEDASYEECRENYQDERDLINALLDAGIHFWDESYKSEPVGGVPDFTWSLTISSVEGYLKCEGRNAYPENLPFVYRGFKAWGFPDIWNEDHAAPDAFLY